MVSLPVTQIAGVLIKIRGKDMKLSVGSAIGLSLMLSSIAAAMLAVLFFPIGIMLDALGVSCWVERVAAGVWGIICVSSGIYAFVKLYTFFQKGN